MATRLLPFLGAIMLFLTASGAARAGWRAPCDNVEWQKLLSCLLDSSGAPPAASFEAGDRKFLRVLFIKNRSGAVVQFVRDASGGLKLDIIDAYQVYPAYAHSVSPNAWREIEARWKAFPAARAKAEAERKAEEAQDKKAGIETVCLHPWDARLETNLSGSVSALEGNGCNHVEIVDFAASIADVALSNAPPCRLIDDGGDAFSPVTLEHCLATAGRPAYGGARIQRSRATWSV